MVATPAEEIEVTRAYLAIESALRREHKLREAASAGHRAAAAVVAVAERVGAELPDPAVTRVARAAATIARGLLSGPLVESDVTYLLHGFRHARPMTLTP
jgi:hypothetical protein